jgi:hypothetical protein
MAKRTQVDLSSLIKVAGESPSNTSQINTSPASQKLATGKVDLSAFIKTNNGEISAEIPTVTPIKKKEESDTESFWGTLFGDSDSEKPAAKAKKNDFINSLAFLDAASYGTGSKVSPKVLLELASQGVYTISEEEKAKRKELDDYYKSEAFLPKEINPFNYDVFGINSLPKLLGAGVFRAGQAMDGIALFMTKAVEDTKALGMQSAMAVATGSLKPFELDTHEKVKKAQQSLQGGDRVKFLGDLAGSLSDVSGVLSRSAKRDIGFTDEEMDKGVSDFVLEGSIGKAIGAAYAGVFENVPQMALLAATGGTSGAVFAGATALGFGAGVADEYKQDKDVTYGDSAIALGKGLVEGVTETIFKTDIDAARTLGKSLFKLQPSDALDAVKKLIKEEGADGAKEAIIRDARTVMKKMLGGGFEEGSEEILATLGEFVIDTTRKGEWSQADYNRLMKQVVDSFVIGAASGGLMSGGAAAVSYKPLEKEQQNKVDRYMEVANNETLSQEVREIAKKKADDIVNYNADKYFSDYTKVANLPMNERVQAVTILSQIKQLEQDKQQVKDLDAIADIDNAIKEKAAKVDEIVQNHAFNLAEEIANSPNAIDGNVAFAPDSNLTVSPDRGYVFHFNSKDEIPESLRGLPALSEGKVTTRDKSIYRIAFTGQDLIDSGLATQAQEVTTDQVSAATSDVETTANTLQEILDKTPDVLPTVSALFQEQEGKTIAQQVAEAYQEAKKNNTNPELVSEVENAIKSSLTAPTMASQPIVTKKTNTRVKNPETLKGMKPTEGVEITPNIENDFKGVLGKMGRGTKRVLQNYVKALRSVHPEAKMFYYEDAVAMEKGLRNSGFSAREAKKRAASAGGLFTTVKNGNVIIHVNRRSDLITSGENAGTQSNIIAAHEIVHAVLLEVARTNPSEFITMKDNLLEMLARDEAANTEIQEFVKRYSDKSANVQAEEFLAQLGALLTRQHAELKRTTLEKIKIGIREFLQKIASKFKSKALMDLVDDKIFSEQAKIEDTARFLEGLGRSLREGTDIDMKYIKNLTKGSREYQQGLRNSVIDTATAIPSGMDINTLMDNEMSVEPSDIKESLSEESNWLENPDNKKRITKYVLNIKGMTEDDIWLAKAIAYNENKGDKSVKLYTLKDKESVLAALENQLNQIEQNLISEVSGQYEFAREGVLLEKTGGYLFTGWKPDYIDSRINLFKNELNTNELIRWIEIRDNENYHKQEVGVIRDIQKKALLANIKEFNGHNEFDPAFSYMLINSIIYNKYQVVNQETGEIKVFKYSQNQLSSTDASYVTLQYDVAKSLYNNENSKESAGDIGISYQKEYMNMDKISLSNSKFSKYIDKKSSTGEGYWLKFPKGENPEIAYDLFEIAKSSHKYSAKWCTGSSDSTAASQLKGGDFYVFVDNKTGDARIAVRYDKDRIAEIRGLGDGQAILANDSGIIQEISDTFEDGKSYESYSKTLSDVKKIGKDFFTKEEFDYFQETGIGSYDSLLKEDRPSDFVKYVAKNLSLSDIARILTEEDRSYGESDKMLQNIQNEIKEHLKPILSEKGESPYAIVNSFAASPFDKNGTEEVQYILYNLYTYGNEDEIYNFKNLVYVNNIEVESGIVIADKLKNVNNYLTVTRGAFYSKSLENVKANIDVAKLASLNVPILKKSGSIKIELSSKNKDLNDFSSLEETRRIDFIADSSNLIIDLPKLKRSSIINLTTSQEAKSVVINLPSINSAISKLSMRGLSGNALVNFNEDSIVEINSIEVNGVENNIFLNVLKANIGNINAENGLVGINAKSDVAIDRVYGGGNFIINNVSKDRKIFTNIENIDLDEGANLTIKGVQYTSLEKVRMRKQSSITGDIDYINLLELGNHSRTEISAVNIKKLIVNRIGKLTLNNNKSIDDLELKDGSTAFISSKKIGTISGFYSNLLAKELESVDNIYYNLQDGDNLFLPNLKEVNNQMTLSGEIDEPSVNLERLKRADVISINEGSFNLLSLEKANIIILQSGLLEAKQLQIASNIVLGDGSELFSPQLNRGYALQSLYGEFYGNGKDNVIFDEEGGRVFEQEKPSDVKESVLGDIGQPSRQELEKRQKKTWGDKIRSVYQDIFERNENARKAFAEADMPFAMYSMYLKAGATPFAMHKFSAYFNDIYSGLDDLMLNQYDKPAGTSQRHLDSIIFLNRVIAIDTNFDNQNKKRPSHPPIPQENGSNVKASKESAETELEKYKQTWGEEYYNELQNRSSKYFEAFSELLKYRYENGLISKETYELYKDYNYSPRVFLEHFVDANGISPNQFAKRGVSLGAEQIKNISGGSVDYMLFDSAQLLKTALISTENRVMLNRSLKFIFEEGVTRKNNVVKDANYDTYKSGQIKLNEDGSPKVKEASNGYVNKTYRDNNGKAYTFQLKSDVAKEFDDVDLAEKKSFLGWLAKNLSGAPILQKMAVSLNPFFGLINPIIDLSTQVMFSNTYKGAGRGLIAQSIAASKTFVGLTKEMLAMNYNEKFGDKTNALSKNVEFRKLIEEYGLYGGFMTTQTEVSAGTNKLAELLGYYGNVTEITAKLSAYKFIKESMLQDYANANIDPATGESKEPSKEEMRNILMAAAYHARNTLDYNRGGKVAKSMSNYVPFLNVNLQVKKIGVKYIIENPSDYVRKMADGIFITAAITMANLIMGADDYEKDKNIKKHKVDKTVIMFPFTYNDLGLDIEGRPYLAIPTPTLAKIFFNIGQVMAEETYYKAVGRENPNKNNPVSRLIEENYNMMARDLVGMWIPPTLKAGISYFTNYDFWTQDVLTKDVKSVGSSQGMGNENILSAFKYASQAIDKLTDKEGVGFGGGFFSPSPERLQKSMEVITTSPTYNAMANNAYWMIDNLFNEAFKLSTGKDIEGKMKSKYIAENAPESIASTFGKGFGRLLKSTEPSKYNEPDFDSEKDIREKVELVDARIATQRNSIYDDLRDMYKESKDKKESITALAEKFTAYESTHKDRKEAEYIHSIGQFLLDKKNVALVTNANKYYTISNVAKDSRAKAFAIWESFGDVRGNEIVLNDLKNIGLTQSVAEQYNGILIEKGLIEPDDDNKPMYEDWYKLMLKNKKK